MSAAERSNLAKEYNFLRGHLRVLSPHGSMALTYLIRLWVIYGAVKYDISLIALNRLAKEFAAEGCVPAHYNHAVLLRK